MICKECNTEMEKRYRFIEDMPGYRTEENEEGIVIAHFAKDKNGREYKLDYADKSNNNWGIYGNKGDPYWCPVCEIIRFDKKEGERDNA